MIDLTRSKVEESTIGKELERLYQADGHGQQRERLIRSQSLDRAPKLSRPLPDPTRNQCGISLDNCVFFAL